MSNQIYLSPSKFLRFPSNFPQVTRYFQESDGLSKICAPQFLKHFSGPIIFFYIFSVISGMWPDFSGGFINFFCICVEIYRRVWSTIPVSVEFLSDRTKFYFAVYRDRILNAKSQSANQKSIK